MHPALDPTNPVNHWSKIRRARGINKTKKCLL